MKMFRDGPWYALWSAYKDAGQDWFDAWGLEVSNKSIDFLKDRGYVVMKSGSYRLTETGYQFARRLDQYSNQEG